MGFYLGLVVNDSIEKKKHLRVETNIPNWSVILGCSYTFQSSVIYGDIILETIFYIVSDFYVLQHDEIVKQAIKEKGHKFRETILAIGGVMAAKEVKT